MICPKRFAAARAAVLAAAAKRDAHIRMLELKYGGLHRSWMLAAEVKRIDQLSDVYDRQRARIWKLLEASPRNWCEGVPSYWVDLELSYDDAIRPVGEALSVVPPIAYGYTRAIA